jgi:DNA polymerase I-like protein with 3'-5' exonuclease and polymerase domains
MEHHGFAVDRKELMDAGAVIGEKIGELTAKIHKLAGKSSISIRLSRLA